MTSVLVHELPARAAELMARLEHVLKSNSDALATELLVRARIQPRPKPQMVLTGQFSSGKSTLIKALTDGQVNPVIGADIATDHVTAYEWDGAVVLVDTPGVQSGLRTHDELAVGAIGEADFVLFVVTAGLFDDAGRDYLRHLANGQQLFGQMIVVITQARKQPAAAGIREKSVQDALGTSTFNLPVAEVDSHYYLRSLEGGSRSEQLRVGSGIDGLRSKINKMSEDRGELAQLRQPLHLIRQLCDEAQQLFIEDHNSKTAFALLAAQRAAVSERRYMIEQALSVAEAAFKSACLINVTAFVDSATSLPADDATADRVLDVAEAKLVEALDRHAEQFARAINRLTEVQFDKLSERLLEIGDSNRAQRLSRPDQDVSLGSPGAPRDRAACGSAGSETAQKVNWSKVADQIKQGQAWWGAGDGLKAASDSIGHNVVKDVGHFFGKKFKPWEAVKIADKIGKIAKVGGFAIQVGLAGYEVWRDERAVRAAQIESERQHAAFVTEIMGHADKIAAEAREQISATIDPPIDAFIAEIQAAQDEILGADRARATSARELSTIASEADRLLAENSEIAH
jgi:hypothetical protein